VCVEQQGVGGVEEGDALGALGTAGGGEEENLLGTISITGGAGWRREIGHGEEGLAWQMGLVDIETLWL
jgi:hypothetical protein